MQIIGYHGTTYESACNILKNGIDVSKLSRKWINDLGRGFYVYIDLEDRPFPNSACENANKYAKTFKSKKQKIGILKVTVNVKDESKILNLTNPRTKKIFSFMSDNIKEAAFDLIPNIKTGASKRNNRDGFLLEYLFKYGYYNEPQVIIENTHTDFAHIRSNFDNGTEMAIRDLSVIEDIKLLS